MPLAFNELKFAPQKRARAGVYRDCPQCGVSFYLTPSRAKTGGDICCSRECRLKYRSVEKTCITCGKAFRVGKATANRYANCSRKCSSATTVYANCERCGKRFRQESSGARKHCSEECRRPPEFMNCRGCGVEFRKLPGDTDRQFCSFACYRHTKAETIPERTARESLAGVGVETQPEHRCGRYSIDFAIADISVALEVDGTYWHQDAARDARKTKFLTKRGWKVVRVNGEELVASDDPTGLILDAVKVQAGIEITRGDPLLF